MRKKDREIEQLRALLEKYQHYQKKYALLKEEVEEKNQLVARRENECRLMRRQAQELTRELEQAQGREKSWEEERAGLVRERQGLEVRAE